MANSLIQFRADDDLRIQAAVICKKLGMDLQTYLRICLARLVNENGIPFSMSIAGEHNEGVIALRKLQQAAEENGVSDMTLDEINEEIRLARAERKSH